MKSDFDMICHKLPSDIEEMHLYGSGDWQIGSENFDENLFLKWQDRVLKDPFGYIVLIGDLVNNGLKTSKTNTYRERYQPHEQRKILRKYLEPMKDRILGVNAGNHELRSVDTADSCPLYDVMDKLELGHLYRENLAFIDLSVGRRSADRQVNYQIVLGHGASSAKTNKFRRTIEGMDVLVTGHIHQPESSFPAKLVIDTHNKVVRTVGYIHLVVPTFEQYGGYVARGMYEPFDVTKTPMLKLNGKEKMVGIEWLPEKY